MPVSYRRTAKWRFAAPTHSGIKSCCGDECVCGDGSWVLQQVWALMGCSRLVCETWNRGEPSTRCFLLMNKSPGPKEHKIAVHYVIEPSLEFDGFQNFRKFRIWCRHFVKVSPLFQGSHTENMLHVDTPKGHSTHCTWFYVVPTRGFH